MIILIIILIIVAVLAMFILWNTKFWFYKDKNTFSIKPNLDSTFNDNVKPIELTHDMKSDKAIIFIHGFPSTPASYAWVSKEAYKEGYDSFAPLLPGFGTNLDEFYKTYFTQWFNYLCIYYENIRLNYKKVYVVGMSMGGAITLKLNERYDSTSLAPTASCTIAAPISMHNPLIGIKSNPGIYFMRFIGLFTPAMKTRINQGYEKENDGDETWQGYSGLYIRQGISFLANLKTIKKDLNKINKPILLIHNETDRTVPYANLSYIDTHINSKDKKVVSYDMSKSYNHNRHILLTYYSIQEDVWSEINNFFNEEYANA